METMGNSIVNDTTQFFNISDMLVICLQVCLDASKICGKTLSMPSEEFQNEFRETLKTMYDTEDFSELKKAWGERYTTLKAAFCAPDDEKKE